MLIADKLFIADKLLKEMISITEVKFTYKQILMGEVVEYSFVKAVENQKEIDKTVRKLLRDPHVIYINYEEVRKY